MVDYREDADFIGRQRKRKRLTPEEIRERKEARAAARSEEDWRSYARDLCYRQLGMMERSVAQLRQSLNRNLVPGNIAEETLTDFIDAGLVSDERYAGMYVRNAMSQKAKSRRAIRAELQRKGIEADIAEQALAQITEEDETSAAIDFACRRAGSMSGLERQVAYRRLYGALARRGFSPEQISRAISEALD
ncbi:MAG: regulatory protein RecX [Actinomycetaceae bacterium]|nr:regulatory protein RecX [Actinomycetaceae bacterium]